MPPLPSVSTSVSGKSGDASSGLNSSFNYNAAFQVGGSGQQRQDAAIAADAGAGTNTLAYIGIGVGILALVATVFFAARKS